MKDNNLLSIIEVITNSPVSDLLSIIGPVQNFYGIYDFCAKAKYQHDIKKLTIFLKKIENANITKKDLANYAKQNLKTKEQLADELRKVIIILSSQIEEEKSEILGNLYIHLIRCDIDYDTFQTLSFILTQLTVSDIQTLIYIFETNPTFATPFDKNSSASRLTSLGLISNNAGTFIGKVEEPRFHPFDEGITLYTYGINCSQVKS